MFSSGTRTCDLIVLLSRVYFKDPAALILAACSVSLVPKKVYRSPIIKFLLNKPATLIFNKCIFNKCKVNSLTLRHQITFSKQQRN